MIQPVITGPPLSVVELVERPPERRLHVPLRGPDELPQDRPQRPDPSPQAELGEPLGPPGEGLPVLGRPLQGDRRDAAEGLQVVLEVRPHGIQQHDLRSGPLRRAGGREGGQEQVDRRADVIPDLRRELAEDLGPGVLRRPLHEVVPPHVDLALPSWRTRRGRNSSAWALTWLATAWQIISQIASGESRRGRWSMKARWTAATTGWNATRPGAGRGSGCRLRPAGRRGLGPVDREVVTRRPLEFPVGVVLREQGLDGLLVGDLGEGRTARTTSETSKVVDVRASIILFPCNTSSRPDPRPPRAVRSGR